MVSVKMTASKKGEQANKREPRRDVRGFEAQQKTFHQRSTDGNQSPTALCS